ncbi:MAG: hypothetical protein J5379_04970, partial [Clostridiales bacterium]|nr:hypothetical protein [Clostridiales bacterium]
EPVAEAPAFEAPAFEAPVAEPVAETPAFEAPVAEPVAEAPAFEAPVAAAAVVGAAIPEAPAAVEDRLPEPPPFAPSEPAPVEGTASAPILAPGQFGTTNGVAPEAAPAPAQPANNDPFQRRSWKDEKLNNGGIVNRGPNG